ncbi:hypothetical protein SLEP1_g58640 [Rubroshorea leprosula]|uniref:Uncharacterized protein n=1 Tax=Rubroshorea leprosula TaxID=152421 RepID=A0AAV5MUH8_9ROSI|nr:hypothetical protein SLEP1_g58640 [Rubroshorea leprosula]
MNPTLGSKELAHSFPLNSNSNHLKFCIPSPNCEKPRRTIILIAAPPQHSQQCHHAYRTIIPISAPSSTVKPLQQEPRKPCHYTTVRSLGFLGTRRWVHPNPNPGSLEPRAWVRPNPESGSKEPRAEVQRTQRRVPRSPSVGFDQASGFQTLRGKKKEGEEKKKEKERTF